MIELEYTMSTYERVLYELGQAGMTDTNPMPMHDIIDALKPHFGSKLKGKSSFNNTFDRSEYFLKHDVGTYILSPDGDLAYTKLYKIIDSEANRSLKLASFFKVYLEDEILRYTDGKSSAVEVNYSKLELWDLDFAEQLITDPSTSIELLENTLHDNEFIAADSSTCCIEWRFMYYLWIRACVYAVVVSFVFHKRERLIK